MARGASGEVRGEGFLKRERGASGARWVVRRFEFDDGFELRHRPGMMMTTTTMMMMMMMMTLVVVMVVVLVVIGEGDAMTRCAGGASRAVRARRRRRRRRARARRMSTVDASRRWCSCSRV